jgi:transposase InsO family protein
MPLRTKSKMEQRLEIVNMAIQDDSNISVISERFCVSRKTIYNWLHRYESEGCLGLEDKPTTPLHSPNRTPMEVEQLVLEIRDEHPRWGSRKIKRSLEDTGYINVPNASTISRILQRNGRINPDDSSKYKAYQRFEKDRPNDHWQMDFKGHFKAGDTRCHPHTVLDDHSRFLLGLSACQDERTETVQDRLTWIFRRYGLPGAIVTDNGPPWAPSSQRRDEFTCLGLWIIRLGIKTIRSKAYHPQTNGKIERFHRTLKAEVLQGRDFRTIDDCQMAFDSWRHVYNNQRPHQALDMDVPSKHYQVSSRSYPEKLPEIEYGPEDQVRKVQYGGWLSFRGKEFNVGSALHGLPVAVRETTEDGIYDIIFVRQRVKQIDLRAPEDTP